MNSLDVTHKSVHLSEALSIQIASIWSKLEMNDVVMTTQACEVSTAYLAPIICFLRVVRLSFVNVQLLAAVKTLLTFVTGKCDAERFFMSFLMLTKIGISLVRVATTRKVTNKRPVIKVMRNVIIKVEFL